MAVDSTQKEDPKQKAKVDDVIENKSEQARKAECLVKELPEDVQMALKAMERTTRVRRVFSSASRPVRYSEVIAGRMPQMSASAKSFTFLDHAAASRLRGNTAET